MIDRKEALARAMGEEGLHVMARHGGWEGWKDEQSRFVVEFNEGTDIVGIRPNIANPPFMFATPSLLRAIADYATALALAGNEEAIETIKGIGTQDEPDGSTVFLRKSDGKRLAALHPAPLPGYGPSLEFFRCSTGCEQSAIVYLCCKRWRGPKACRP